MWHCGTDGTYTLSKQLLGTHTPMQYIAPLEPLTSCLIQQSISICLSHCFPPGFPHYLKQYACLLLLHWVEAGLFILVTKLNMAISYEIMSKQSTNWSKDFYFCSQTKHKYQAKITTKPFTQERKPFELDQDTLFATHPLSESYPFYNTDHGVIFRISFMIHFAMFWRISISQTNTITQVVFLVSQRTSRGSSGEELFISRITLRGFIFLKRRRFRG